MPDLAGLADHPVDSDIPTFHRLHDFDALRVVELFGRTYHWTLNDAGRYQLAPLVQP